MEHKTEVIKYTLCTHLWYQGKCY